MDSKNLINWFVIKKDRSPDYLCNNHFFGQFFNNFSALLLLCKLYIFDFFNTVDFFQIFVLLRSTKIFIIHNFWLGVYYT